MLKGTLLGPLRPPFVILSAAKDLWLGLAEILRCAQDDSSAKVNAYGATRAVALPKTDVGRA